MPTKSTDEKKPPAGVAERNDVNGDELLFELRGPDGQVWRLYLDGRTDGFPAGTLIENYAFPRWMALKGEGFEEITCIISSNIEAQNPVPSTHGATAGSFGAANSESVPSPNHHGLFEAEPPGHGYGSLQFGQPHQAFHETEDERKNRLSGQRIAESRARLMPGK